MATTPKLVNPRSTADTHRTLIILDEQGRKETTLEGWTTRSGGELTSEASNLDGDRQQGSFVIGGGGGTRADITLTTMFNLEDEVKWVKYLESRLGYRVQYISQPINKAGEPVGEAYIFSGKLIGVTPPEEGNRAATDGAMVSVTIKAVA